MRDLGEKIAAERGEGGLIPTSTAQIHPAEVLGDGEDVLVAAAAEVDDHQWSLGFFGAMSSDLGDARGRGSSAGMMPSSLRAELEGLERLLVGRRDVLDPADIVQPGVLGADAGIVEAGARSNAPR